MLKFLKRLFGTTMTFPNAGDQWPTYLTQMHRS